jgi:hypothetical protein
MEAVFINAVLYIATCAAVIKFALFEWEGVVRVWTRVLKMKGRRGTIQRRSKRT